jgi:hypothetical protein
MFEFLQYSPIVENKMEGIFDFGHFQKCPFSENGKKNLQKR